MGKRQPKQNPKPPLQAAPPPFQVKPPLIPAPPEQGQMVMHHKQTVVHHQGPLPPPEILQQYERMSPGIADRLLATAEREQEHRHRIEARANETNIELAKEEQRQRKTGQWLALIVGLVLIGSSVLLALHGHDWVAGILGGTTLIGALGLFLAADRKKK